MTLLTGLKNTFNEHIVVGSNSNYYIHMILRHALLILLYNCMGTKFYGESIQVVEKLFGEHFGNLDILVDLEPYYRHKLI